jgi:hypothetical protein
MNADLLAGKRVVRLRVTEMTLELLAALVALKQPVDQSVIFVPQQLDDTEVMCVWIASKASHMGQKQR